MEQFVGQAIKEAVDRKARNEGLFSNSDELMLFGDGRTDPEVVPVQSLTLILVPVTCPITHSLTSNLHKH